VQIGGDVGGMHDSREAHQRWVRVEVVLVYEDLKGAFGPAVRVGGVLGVEGVPVPAAATART
jgi:hypothetical protein